MGKKSRRKAFQAKRRKGKKNPLFLNIDSSEWKDPKRTRFAVGYSVPAETTPEQEALWVRLLKDAHCNSLGQKELQPPKLPKPTKPKKPKKIKIKRYKVEISLIGTEL